MTIGMQSDVNGQGPGLNVFSCIFIYFLIRKLDLQKNMACNGKGSDGPKQ